MKQILMVGFSGILDTGQVRRRKMRNGKLINEKLIASRFRGKLIKMIKDADHSILTKIRQILLHWGYELTEKKIFLLTWQTNV